MTLSMAIPAEPTAQETEEKVFDEYNHEEGWLEEKEVEMFDEVVDYLQHVRGDVRVAALVGLCQYTQTHQFIRYATGQPCLELDSLKSRKERVERLVNRLLITIGDPSKVTVETGDEAPPGKNASELAAVILINFAGSTLFNNVLAKKYAFPRIVDNLASQLKSEAPTHRNLNMKLIHNLVVTREGCRNVMAKGEDIEAYDFLRFINLIYPLRMELENVEIADLIGIFHSLSYYEFSRPFVMDDPCLEVVYAIGLQHTDPGIVASALTVLKQLAWSDTNHKRLLEFQPKAVQSKIEGCPFLLESLTALILPPKGTARDACLAEDRNRNPMEQDHPRVFTSIVLEAECPLTIACEKPFEIIREAVIQAIVGLLRSPHGRTVCRESDLYDVVRLSDQEEDSETIKKMINDHVHLLVYTEAELEQQDRELR